MMTGFDAPTAMYILLVIVFMVFVFLASINLIRQLFEKVRGIRR